MKPFRYLRPPDTTAALHAVADRPGAKFVAGGTNLVDLMREGIETPHTLVDVSDLPLDEVRSDADGSLRVGAIVRNSVLASHPLVTAHYPVLSQALLSGASGQLRNVATVGGNVLQRTRCLYFYDLASACNKRSPGTGCDAIGGFNRMNAVLGTTDRCIAVHPSDMCVALVALDANVELLSLRGRRVVPVQELHPADAAPDVETVLAPDELITAVLIPAAAPGTRSWYWKVRDRASYAFAMISVAVRLRLEHGRIAEAGIGFGGLAPRPWRAVRAEAMLLDREPDADLFRAAGEAELADAVGRGENDFKIELVQRVLAAALRDLTADGGAA
jgi:xanthine dehydrogenase YagS FAD-binding subunit